MARKLSEIILSFPEFQGADSDFVKSNLVDVLNSGDQNRIGKMVSRLQTVPEYQGMSGDDIVKNVSGIIGVQAKTPAPIAEQPTVGMGDLRAYESQQGPISTTPIQMAKPQEQEKPRPSYELQPSSVLKSKPVNTAPEGSPASALLNLRPEAVDPSLQQPEIKEAPKTQEISPTKGLVTGTKRMATSSLDAAALILKKSGVKDSEKLIATGAIERPEIVTKTLDKLSGPVQALADKINASITEEEKSNEQAAQEVLLEAVKNPSQIKENPVKIAKAFLTNVSLSTPQTITAMVPYVGMAGMMAGEGGTWVRNAREMGVEDTDLQKQGAISYGIPSGIIEFYTDKLIMAPLGGKNNPLAKGLSKIINKVTRPAFMKLAKPVMETLGASFTEGSEEWLQGNWDKAVGAMMVKKQKEKFIADGQPEKATALEQKFKKYVDAQDNESAFILGTLAGLGMAAGARVAGKTKEAAAKEEITTEGQVPPAPPAAPGAAPIKPGAPPSEAPPAKQGPELPPDLQPVETVEQIKAKPRTKASDEIVKPLEHLDRQIAEEKDPRVKEILQDNRDMAADVDIFNEPGKQVLRSPALFDKSLRKLDAQKIPYTYFRIDLGNVTNLNLHRKGVHATADEDMRRVNGDTVIKEINDAGGFILRPTGADELRGALPYHNKADTEELLESARQNGLKIAQERGLDKLPYHIKGSEEVLPNFGSLDFAYGAVDAIPGKYGEMDRQADAIQGAMKENKIDKHRKSIYIKSEEKGGPNEQRSVSSKVEPAVKRDLGASAEEAKGRPVAEAVSAESVVAKPEEPAAAAKVEPAPVSAATEAEKLIPPDVKKAIEIGKNTDRLLAERKYKLAKRQPRSQKEELFFAKRGYKPYLWDEKTNDLKTSTLGVWAKETAETPKPVETPEQKFKEGSLTPEEITSVPATRFGKKALENPSPNLVEFVKWQRDRYPEKDYGGAKLSTYEDGEPYFKSPMGAEVSLSDYEKRIKIEKKSEPAKEQPKETPKPEEKKVATEAKATQEEAEKPVQTPPKSEENKPAAPAQASPEAAPKEFETPATSLEPGDLIATKTAAGVLRVKRPWKKGQTLFATTDMDSPIEKASTDRTFHAKAIEAKPFYLMEKGTKEEPKETPKEAEKVEAKPVPTVPEPIAPATPSAPAAEGIQTEYDKAKQELRDTNQTTFRGVLYKIEESTKQRGYWGWNKVENGRSISWRGPSKDIRWTQMEAYQAALRDMEKSAKFKPVLKLDNPDAEIQQGIEREKMDTVSDYLRSKGIMEHPYQVTFKGNDNLFNSDTRRHFIERQRLEALDYKGGDENFLKIVDWMEKISSDIGGFANKDAALQSMIDVTKKRIADKKAQDIVDEKERLEAMAEAERIATSPDPKVRFHDEKKEGVYSAALPETTVRDAWALSEKYIITKQGGITNGNIFFFKGKAPKNIQARFDLLQKKQPELDERYKNPDENRILPNTPTKPVEYQFSLEREKYGQAVFRTKDGMVITFNSKIISVLQKNVPDFRIEVSSPVTAAKIFSGKDFIGIVMPTRHEAGQFEGIDWNLKKSAINQLMNKLSEKQPWQMTREEFAEKVGIPEGKKYATGQPNSFYKSQSDRNHKTVVRIALEREYPVPPEVLAEYPDLQKPTEAEQPAETPSEGIQDFGQKIGGAKKDLWKTRGLLREDMEDMTQQEKESYATKANVWPDADYAKMVEDGMPVNLAYLVKKIKDSISIKPEMYSTEKDDPEARDAILKRYVEIVSKIKERLPAIRNLDDLKALKNELFPVVQEGEWNRSYTKEANKDLLIIGGRKVSQAFQPNRYDLESATRKAAETGFPQKQEAWQKQFEIHVSEAGKEIMRGGKTVKLEKPEFFVTRKRAYSILQTFDTREEAESWAKDQASSTRGETLQRPFNRNVRREGEDYRKGKDVTGQDILNTFGFRGGEFGLWENDADRQQSLNQAYDGLKDLAKALNIPDKSVSLNGELGIAFGARGSGAAGAHYEPSKVVINLTKTNGSGALAHEWAHAVDDYFGRIATKGKPAQFLSHRTKGLVRPEVYEAWGKVMDTIESRIASKESTVKRVQERVTKMNTYIDSWLKPIDEAIAKAPAGPMKDQATEFVAMLRDRKPKIFNGEKAGPEQITGQLKRAMAGLGYKMDTERAKGISNNAWHLESANVRLAKAEAGELQDREDTDFLRNAKEKKTPYWRRPHELFARAFESYVEDRVEIGANRSPYLVTGTHEDPASPWGNIYPYAIDREAINKAMDNLFRTIQTKEQAGQMPMFLREGETAFVAPEETPGTSPDQISLFTESESTDVSPLITSAEIEFPIAYKKFIPKGFDVRYIPSLNYFMRNSEGTPVGIGRFKDTEAACISVDRKNQRATIFINPRANPNEIAQIFKHEMRHFGLRMLTDANPGLMNQAASLMAADDPAYVAALRKTYPDANEQAFLEEWLIRRLNEHEDGIAHEAAEQNIIKRVWQAFRRWWHNALAKMGWREPKTREEIFDSIVSEMRDLRPREEVGLRGELEPAFAKWRGVATELFDLRKKLKDYAPIDYEKLNNQKGHPLDNVPKNTKTINVKSSVFKKEVSSFEPTGENIAYHERPLFLNDPSKDWNSNYWEKEIKNGQRPPVMIGIMEGQLRVIDGNHRLNAYLRNNIQDIPSIFTEDAKNYLTELEPAFNRPVTVDTFFSPTLRAVEGLKQEKGVVPQLQSMIRNGQLKKAEVEWMGLKEWLDANPQATKTQVADFVRSNQVTIEEVQKSAGEGSGYRSIEDVQTMAGTHKYAIKNFNGDFVLNENGNVRTWKRRSEAEDFFSKQPAPTKFSQYVLPSGSNYREVLLKMPERKLSFEEWVNRTQSGRAIDSFNSAAINVLRVAWKNNDKNYNTGIDKFTSSHWSEPNVFAHARLDDRVGPNGEKVLFVEEIQSDWAREAREKGVATEITKDVAKQRGFIVYKAKSTNLSKANKDFLANGALGKKYEELSFAEKKALEGITGGEAYFIDNPTDEFFHRKGFSNFGFDTEAEAWNSVIEKLKETSPSVPAQPFLKNWQEVTLKRILRMAAEEGYDSVAWISGEQTADRYDLSKQVDKITWSYNPETDLYGITAIRDGNHLIADKEVQEKDISGFIGKDAAEKIINSEQVSNAKKLKSVSATGELSGLDLKIGGEWAANLYDKQIPDIMNKIGKRFGAKVESVDVGIREGGIVPGLFPSVSKAEKWIEENAPDEGYTTNIEPNYTGVSVRDSEGNIVGPTQLSLPITPSMRTSVMEEGQPMFLRQGEITEDLPKIAESEGQPTGIVSRETFNGEGVSKTIKDRFFKVINDKLRDKKTKESIKDRFIRSFQEKYIHVKRMQERFEEKTGQKLTDEYNTYLKTELYKGKTGYWLNNFEKQDVEPLSKMIHDSGVSVDELDLYLYAKHAEDRNSYISGINAEFVGENEPLGGSGMTNAEAEIILNYMDDISLTKKIEPIAKKVYDIIGKTRQVLLNSGMADRKMLVSWQRDFGEFYVPLKGFEDVAISEEKGSFPNLQKGFNVPALKHAMGRKTKAANITANVILGMNEAIINGEKNTIGQTFAKFLKEYPEATKARIIAEQEIKYFDRDTREVKTMLRRPMGENILKVWENGTPVYVEIKDPLLARALLNLGAKESNMIMQAMAKINRGMSMLYTSLSPEFVISNFSRDIQGAIANISADESMRIAKDVVKGIPGAMKGAYGGIKGEKETEWQQYFQEFRHAGGKIEFFSHETAEEVEKRIVKQIGHLNSEQNRLYGIAKSAFGIVERLNGAVENATRLSTYVAMRKAGKSKEQSASIARNITVDFNKGGEMSSGINALYMFANANIQGSARLIKAIGTKKGMRNVGTIAVAGFLMAEMARLMMGSDDDGRDKYDKIPAWIRNNNWIIPNPYSEKGYIKFPIPYGYGFFYAAGQGVNNLIHEGNAPDFAIGIAGSAFDAFNPLGASSTPIQTFTPSQLRWITDIALNRNFFGANIYKEKMYSKEPYPQLASKHATEWAKALAEALNKASGGGTHLAGKLNLPPDAIDYVASYYGGGILSNIGQLTSVTKKLATGESKTISIRQIPFARKLYGTIDEYTNIGSFYENSTVVGQTYKEYEYLKNTTPEAAEEFKNQNKERISSYFMFKWADKKMGDLRAERKKTVENKDKKRTEEIDKEMITVANKANAMLYRGKGKLTEQEIGQLKLGSIEAADRNLTKLINDSYLTPEQRQKLGQEGFKRATEQIEDIQKMEEE